jgi:hypothetical protein
MRRRRCAHAFGITLLAVSLAGMTGTAQAPAPVNAKTWLQDPKTIEEYLKSAEVVRLEDLKVGVTKPRQGQLAPGGPVSSIAWKAIRPGRYNGFWESYKNEIAAYELDKLLGLGMVPPTVEKKIKGEVGAAIMWVSPTESFKQMGGIPGQKGVKMPPPAQAPAWNRQITRAKMFDDLIGNIDPNLGNWLVDPAWNLILIDHTRAFTSTKDLYHQLVTIDPELWERMKALDEESLTNALGNWLDKGSIKAILQRRDKMQQVIDKMPKT